MTTTPRTGDGARSGAARRLTAFAGLAVAAALATGACSEAITDPSTPVAIAFDSMPPVVEGDTMRDPETGAIVPLNAHAFNSKGDTIPGAPFVFFARDTSNPLAFVDGNYVVARPGRRTTPVTVIASLNGLQLSRTINIVPRPEVLLRAADTMPILTLIFPDSPANVSYDSIKVRVMHDSLGVDSVPVPGWVVRFEVEDPGERLADSVRLVASVTSGSVASAPASPVDTTDATGLASRRVRIFAKADAAPGTLDTVIVTASASYKGVPLTASPIKFLVPIARAGASAAAR